MELSLIPKVRATVGFAVLLGMVAIGRSLGKSVNPTISTCYQKVWAKRASLIFMVFQRDHPNPFYRRVNRNSRFKSGRPTTQTDIRCWWPFEVEILRQDRTIILVHKDPTRYPAYRSGHTCSRNRNDQA
jgi:hypothetical protein